jgi:hypothetical protein
MFSQLRKDLPETELSQVGLYWRADTQFASAMTDRNVPQDTWAAAFAHMSALIIGIEVLDSLRSIAASTSPLLTHDDVEKVNLGSLGAFESSLPDTVEGLRKALKGRFWGFESWVNDVRKCPEPWFLPGQKFIFALIDEIRSQLPTLSQTVFFVYVDEYENLCTYQQRIINTWLKHSEPPLIFNLAMKRNAFETLETVGTESLSDIHDFRKHDLEQYFLEEDTESFFAEILFLKLANAGVDSAPVNVVDLRDLSKLPERKNAAYRKKIINAVETMFPDVPHLQLALDVFEDDSLSKKLRKRIKQALDNRDSTMRVERFFRPNLPEATIVIPPLLNRKRIQPEDIAEEMDRLEKGEKNHFTGKKYWTQNNFIGSLLQLYEPYDRACPFYAGFHTFLKLSRGNIRHFLELCHKSIARAFPDGGYQGNAIAPEQQAEAARQASTAFLGEVRSFGRYGNKLHLFVLRLGSLFAMTHLRPSLSESEQSHFSVVRGTRGLEDSDQAFIREATKWSVLFEEKATKIKQSYEPETVEYVLNPIYAPYFHISYRKRRKLELKSEELIKLIRGSYEEMSELLKRYRERLAVDPEHMNPTLFSHLEEDEE